MQGSGVSLSRGYNQAFAASSFAYMQCGWQRSIGPIYTGASESTFILSFTTML